ncbi:MAG: hypothetical protein M0R06_01120 [Sphaerochaeta sp.]|jgi:hypothetical protein|nr:hypothetical protein [Sphaerochaeta sp.]
MTIENTAERINARRRARYAYARRKGFSAAEANYLASRTTAHIDALAKAKGGPSCR